jgi:5-formyltetrahydrofolate cyclo-ligase
MGRTAEGDATTAAKAALRARVRHGRSTAPEVGEALCRTALGSAPVRDLLAAPDPRTVLAYAAVPGEPDLAGLRGRLRTSGVRVVLPVVTGPWGLAWAVDTGSLAPGRPLPGGLRLPEPDPAGAVPLPDLALGPGDLVLVPALAVSRDGTRLGQGGGFYDRALGALPRHPSGPLVVAVVHDDELLGPGEVPSGPHDLRVDAVLTPSAWVPLDGAARG